jgi:hypothetical protein
MSRGKAPDYCLRGMHLNTQREFRRQKREEWRKVRNAFEEFRCGAAYLPCPETFEAISYHMKVLTVLISPKEWGK